MSDTPNWQHRAATTIHQAYPEHDLLPIDPPQVGEAIGTFAARAEEAGDTLFLFLCREANDDVDVAEYASRLDRAISDVRHVRDAFLNTEQ